MTISVSLSPSTIASVDTSEGGNGVVLHRAAVANNDIVAVFFEASGDGLPDVEARYILYNRQTDTPGTYVVVNDDPDTVNPVGGGVCTLLFDRIENNRLLAIFNNDPNSSGYGAVITNSGLVPAVQPHEMFFEANGSNYVRNSELVAAKHSQLATGIMAYRTNEAGEPPYYQTFTVASGNVSFGTAVPPVQDTLPLAAIHLTGNKYLVAELWTGLTIRVLDTISGITVGDRQIEPTATFANAVQLCRIDDSRALAVFFDADTGIWYSCVCNLFGSLEIVYGDPLTLQTGAGVLATRGCTTIINRGSGIFTVGYQISSTNWKFESLSVSGSTVTKLNDDTTVTLGQATDAYLLGFDGTEGGLVYADQGDETVKYRAVSNLPGEGPYRLWMYKVVTQPDGSYTSTSRGIKTA